MKKFAIMICLLLPLPSAAESLQGLLQMLDYETTPLAR